MKYLLLVFLIPFSFAGPGHNHKHGHSHSHSKKNLSKEKLKELGMAQISHLIKDEKIDKSWAQAKHEDSVKKKTGKTMEWLVTFENSSGVKGKKLFIFFKLSGDFVAANFSGK